MWMWGGVHRGVFTLSSSWQVLATRVFMIEKPFYFKVYDNYDDNSNNNTLYLWFCYRRCITCHRKKSLRTGSFFAEFPRISLGKIIVCIYLWSLRELRTVAAQMLSLTKNTVGNIYALLRHYCGRDVQDQPFIPFGGRVYVTKCDESQFNHKYALVVLISIPQKCYDANFFLQINQ